MVELIVNERMDGSSLSSANPSPCLDVEQGCVCPVETCGNTFKSSSQLRMHLIRHHNGCQVPVKTGVGELLFCPVKGCSRGQGSEHPFPRLGQLKQHYHTKHGHKEYKCERCGKAFGLRDVFSRHRTECGAVFQCETCSDYFRTKNALYQHAKRKKHKLPAGSKPRKVTSKNVDSPHQNPTLVIIVKQVVPLPKQSTKSPAMGRRSVHLHPRQTRETSTQTVDFSASTAHQDDISPVYIHRVDASTQLHDLQIRSAYDIDSLVSGVDASTNTIAMDLSLTDSTIDQLTDTSSNTISTCWSDVMAGTLSHDLLLSDTNCDANTSTECNSMSNFATQTDIEDLHSFMCDLATQTDLEVPVESSYQSDNFSSGTLSDDLTRVEISPLTAGCTSSDSMGWSQHQYTHSYGAGPSRQTVDYGVQTSDEYHNIVSQLLSEYKEREFGTQTAEEYTGVSGLDFTSSGILFGYGESRLTDFSTQTHPDHILTEYGMSDSCTQTQGVGLSLDDSGTQTTAEYTPHDGYSFVADSGTQTSEYSTPTHPDNFLASYESSDSCTQTQGVGLSLGESVADNL